MGTITAAEAVAAEPRREVRTTRTRGDRAYRLLTTGGGLLTLVILVLIGLFLLLRALPALRVNGLSFFTTKYWNPDGTGHHSGVLAVAYGTVEIAVIALILAVPVSLLSALYLTQYAPERARGLLTTVVDLLAAIPSLIYGIWAFFVLQPHLLGLSAWLAAHLGFIPIFSAPSIGPFASSPFIVGVMVALMLLPTATSVMREVFAQAPVGEKEAALALGASRWRMIRTVVLPFGKAGIVGGSMLAMGRAMGESISVAIIINAVFTTSPHILQSGGNSIGALIADRFSDATAQYGLPALMAAGLVLFGMTLLVNTAASLIVRSARSGKGVEI